MVYMVLPIIAGMPDESTCPIKIICKFYYFYFQDKYGCHFHSYMHHCDLPTCRAQWRHPADSMGISRLILEKTLFSHAVVVSDLFFNFINRMPCRPLLATVWGTIHVCVLIKSGGCIYAQSTICRIFIVPGHWTLNFSCYDFCKY